MNNLLLMLGTALFTLAGNANAQDQDKLLPDIPPPTPPLIARASNPSAWVVMIKPKAKGPLGPSQNPNLPLKYLSQQYWVKMGDKVRCENQWTDGTKTTDWVAGAAELTQNPQGGALRIFDPSSHPAFHDFTQGDFLGLDWLTMDDYVGAVDYQKETCYLFRAKKLAPKTEANAPRHDIPLADMHAPTSPTTVLINAKTHLPVVIANDDGVFLFQFQAAPAGDLQMNEPVASLWKAFMERR